MITFVWYSNFPFLAGAGGTEAFTAGIVRELLRRGIPTRIATVGFGVDDGRDGFPDIPFVSVATADDVADLDGKLIVLLDPPMTSRHYDACLMLHLPVWLYREQGREYLAAARRRQVIANSRFAARECERFLGRPSGAVPVVYPFGDVAFSNAATPPRHDEKVRVLCANRLTPHKGIYTFLTTLHSKVIADDPRFEFTVVGSASHTRHGLIIEKLIRAHPMLNVVPALHSSEQMAALMVMNDILVIPSSMHYWRETFGMLSVEGQKSGCRVVASANGGLPETDCGGLILVEPDDPRALAEGLARAADLGRLTEAERIAAAGKFTVRQSVDSLLAAIGWGCGPVNRPGPDPQVED